MADGIIAPDLGGRQCETMPECPDADHCSIVPDQACELLSPSTGRIDQDERRMIYAREGVPHLWLVDPDAKTQEAFALRDGHWVHLTMSADDAPVELPPFGAVSFALDRNCREGSFQSALPLRQTCMMSAPTRLCSASSNSGAIES